MSLFLIGKIVIFITLIIEVSRQIESRQIRPIEIQNKNNKIFHVYPYYTYFNINGMVLTHQKNDINYLERGLLILSSLFCIGFKMHYLSENIKLYCLLFSKLAFMHPYQPQIPQKPLPLVIGYYPFRGRVQICRLLCEYLHVPYTDHLFTPEQWSQYKANEACNWIMKDLPFCKDGNFVVTGPSGMAHYILQKQGRADLLGNNLTDRIKIDSIRSKHDIRDAILGLICQARSDLPPDDQKNLQFYWRNKIHPILKDYETQCPETGWYYGYLTVMDFLVYELFNLVQFVFPNQVKVFKKLTGLRYRFSCISEIQSYQNSQRALKEYCPVAYFNKFKQHKIKGHGNTPPNTQMDVEQ